MNKQTNIILLASHGGVVPTPNGEGIAMTSGKRSNGTKTLLDKGIIEGYWTRQMCALIKAKIDTYCWFESDFGKPLIGNAIFLNPGPIDICKKDRVFAVNKVVHNFRTKHNMKSLLIEIHSNASPDPGWSDAHGIKIWHCQRASAMSIKFAKEINKALVKVPELMGSRGIGVANHTITKKTRCPAILADIFFHTNREQCHDMKDPVVQKLIAEQIVEGILNTLK